MQLTLVPDLQKYPHAWPMTWNLVKWEPAPPAGATGGAAGCSGRSSRPRRRTRRWRWCGNTPVGGRSRRSTWCYESSCQVEDLRLETWDRLEKAVRVNVAVAARIVLLRDLARETPEAPALEVLSEDEVEVLVCRFGKGMKPSELTIGQAVLWIGRLGGHLNRKRDGMPGVRTYPGAAHRLTFACRLASVPAKDCANSCG